MLNVQKVNRLLGLIVIALTFFANVALADDVPLYPKSTIAEWEPEFRAMIEDNYARMFQPKLSNDEARKLRGMRFEFSSNPQSVLFDFSASPDRTVRMPVASLLFLKDLAGAQAWLELSGYSAQPVLDYLAIIRQGRLAEWPEAERLPLQALGIPADGLKGENVLARRNDILDKLLFFIMAHELGHIVHGLAAHADCKINSACDFQKVQQSEANADAFAVEIFRRMGLVPSASNFFFALNSRLSRMPFEFKNDAEWQDYAKGKTHPLDAARISNVAVLIKANRDAFARGFDSPEMGALKVKQSVSDLHILANLIQDRNLSGMQIAWAKSLEPDDIKPRKSHEPKLRPTKNDVAATQALVGYFTGEAQFSNGGSAPIEVLMRTHLTGAQISGEVMLGGIRGRIEGQSSDAKHASATWIVAGDTYRVTLEAATPGELRATYKSTTTESVTGLWALGRKR